MSVKAMAWCWEHSRAEGTALLLQLAIADHASNDGDNAWPSQAKLARKCRISVRSIRRHLDALAEIEEIAVEEYAGPAISANGGRRTHRYSLPRYAASLADNHEVDGQSGREPEEGCRTDPEGCRPNEAGLSDTALSGEPSEPSIEPSALFADFDPLANRMYVRFGALNKRVKLDECKRVVAEARAANISDHVIDQEIGYAISRGAKSPRYVTKALGLEAVAS